MGQEIIRLMSSVTLLMIVYWCFKTNRRIKAIEDDLQAIEDDLHRNAHCRR